MFQTAWEDEYVSSFSMVTVNNLKAHYQLRASGSGCRGIGPGPQGPETKGFTAQTINPKM